MIRVIHPGVFSCDNLVISGWGFVATTPAEKLLFEGLDWNTFGSRANLLLLCAAFANMAGFKGVELVEWGADDAEQPSPEAQRAAIEVITRAMRGNPSEEP